MPATIESPVSGFTLEDVQRWFDVPAIDEAQRLVPLVRDLEIDADRIKATISDSERKPEVAIFRFASPVRGQRALYNTCTCRQGGHCAHVVAMLLKVLEERGQKDRIRPGVLSWVEELRRVAAAVTKKKTKPTVHRHQLFYMLDWTPDARGFGVTLHKGRDPDSAEEWWSVDRALIKPPQFVTEEDLGILRLLWAERTYDAGLRAFGLGPKHGNEVLLRMVQSGRLCPLNDPAPLHLAEARPASVVWQVDVNGRQVPFLRPTPPVDLVIPLLSPWYVDLDEGLIGPLDVVGNPAVIARLFSLPPLSAKEASLVAEALTELAPELPTPAEDASARLRIVDAAPVPVLYLKTLITHGNRNWRDYSANYAGGPFDLALPVFRYADAEIRPDDAREFSLLPGGETVRVLRDSAREKTLMDLLTHCALQ